MSAVSKRILSSSCKGAHGPCAGYVLILAARHSEHVLVDRRFGDSQRDPMGAPGGGDQRRQCDGGCGGEWEGCDLFVGNAQAEEQALATSSEGSDGGILCAICGVPLASRTELVCSIFTALQSRNVVWNEKSNSQLRVLCALWPVMIFGRQHKSRRVQRSLEWKYAGSACH